MSEREPRFNPKSEQPAKPEHKPQVEQELSLEVREKIMDKVDDIFEYGVAYTCIINSDEDSFLKQGGKFETTLKNGVLGVARDYDHDKLNRPEPHLWKNNLREGHQVTVSFNIQGRSFSDGVEQLLPATHTGSYEPRNPSINVPVYLDQLHRQNKERHHFGDQYFRGAALIFYISDLEEILPKYMSGGDHRVATEEGRKKYATPYPLRTFGIRGPVSETIQTPDSKGNLCTTTEYGFSMSSRIPPRRFRGIVVNWKLERDLSQIVDIMKNVYQKKPQLLMPIYDARGNTIWPSKMSYEEVRQYVALRNQRRQGG